jgi:branched-chain amino acid transport system permease protein
VSVIGLTQTIWLLVAALGVALSVCYAGLPFLGQSAFVAVGGYAVVLLGPGGLGLALGLAAATAVLLGGILGYLVARGFSRLDGGYFALGTWALGWLAQHLLTAFPDTFGGSEGISRTVPARLVSPTFGVQIVLTDKVNVGLAVLACLLAMLTLMRLGRGPAGLDLAGLRTSPVLAASLGVPIAARRRAVLTATAVLGAASGAGSSIALGVISASDVSPLLSLELLVAVLIGGSLRWWGPLLAAALLWAVSPDAVVLLGLADAPLRGVLTAVLLFTVVAGRSVLSGRRGVPGMTQYPLHAGAVPPAQPLQRDTVLDLAHATVRYAGVTALDDVSLKLRPGQVHAVIGPNGSGKSSLLDVLAGNLSAGEVRIDGQRQRAHSVRDRVLAGVVRTPQRPVVPAELTPVTQAALGFRGANPSSHAVLRHLFATPRSRAQGRELAAAVTAALRLTGLGELGDSSPARLTAGQRQLLQLARAIATGAPILLLDEPAAGMTPAERVELQAILRQLAGAGTAVLVVEHDLRFIGAVADWVTVLVAGRIVAAGTVNSVRADPEVRAALLGSA